MTDHAKSRLINHNEMTTDQIIQCSYDAMAIVALCAVAARSISEDGSDNTCGGDIAMALELSGELFAQVHDTLEMHEGSISSASHEQRAHVHSIGSRRGNAESAPARAGGEYAKVAV